MINTYKTADSARDWMPPFLATEDDVWSTYSYAWLHLSYTLRQDLACQEFLDPFTRFSRRQGQYAKLYSGNSTTIVRANRILGRLSNHLPFHPSTWQTPTISVTNSKQPSCFQPACLSRSIEFFLNRFSVEFNISLFRMLIILYKSTEPLKKLLSSFDGLCEYPSHSHFHSPMTSN